MIKRAKHKDVRVTNGFWKAQLDKIHHTTVHDILNKFQQDGDGAGLMKNYEWVIGGEKDKHVGPPWYDGLICETIRGISDIIAHTYDKTLDDTIESYAQIIAAAQDKDPDGYINTYGTLMCPENRWGERGGNIRWQHELYNTGCLIEAGVHYYLATGKTLLLNCAVRAANHMCGEMGPAPRKNIVPAHSLPEEAVAKLYRLFTDEPELANTLKKEYGTAADAGAYLNLGLFWNDHRGVHHNRASHPRYLGEYAQDHCPVCDQSEAVGHAVRAALMYTGMTATGIEAGRREYLDAAKRIWDNVVTSKLHISGGIGAMRDEERFGYQYELPNNAYLETCAGVAMAFWAGEMHRVHADGAYVDVFERALYNNVLPCLSADGTHYFYENPLVSDGTVERWVWHGCPCCPPMFLKLMGALPDYIYSYTDKAVYLNLHIGSSFRYTINGQEITVSQENCGIPWSGENTVRISAKTSRTFDLAVRIPEWAGKTSFKLKGKALSPETVNGYAVISREWAGGDTLQISMELPVMRMEAHPYVRENAGRIAIQRGPLLYCVEAADNGGGTELLLGSGKLTGEEADLFGRTVLVKGTLADGGAFTAIPYYLWNNRGKGEMAVWLKQDGKPQPHKAHRGTAVDGVPPDMTGWEGRLYREYTVD